MQDAISRLAAYWNEQGCMTVQPMNTEVGAGTLNQATLLRVLGPEPWRVAYVEPSVRPDDSRYGENPNRLQTHTQFQVILKPDPGNSQELYLGSLRALGIDVDEHDVRFVEDNWAAPAMGAWGLGWEVWLDGLEITQFTYFQQSGGVILDPVSVEITYGIERIIMALQDVTHFKDILYAPGISYGELFGQSEYEMSRYYLDDANVVTQRELLELYAGEAERTIAVGLPVPAHLFVLKCSHTFNVLDSRGVISTAERAVEFGRMRGLAARVSSLWESSREQLGYPLGLSPVPPPAVPAALGDEPGTERRQLVFEIGTEELPPEEAQSARAQLEREIRTRLGGTRLRHGYVQVLATPRRLVALVEDVAPLEEDTLRTVRGPKVTASFTADGSPTPAAVGFARSHGVQVGDLGRAEFGNLEHVVVTQHESGRRAEVVLAEVLVDATRALRPAKNMRWSDPALAFSRPIRWLLALWGDRVVPVSLSTLAAGRETWLHRAGPAPIVSVPDAESYLDVVRASGIVPDPQERRATICERAQQLAAEANGTATGGRVDLEAEKGLLDQITYLVEQPIPLLGGFDERYLELPEAVLTAVMRKHQRYLPVRDAAGALLPFFVVVANGQVDEDKVRAGNEAVLRARYEDAAFFYRADRQVPLAELRSRLTRLTFTDRLGSMADRADRIGLLARALAEGVDLGCEDASTLARAAELVKFDLGSQLVTEMTSLAGIMARDYALNAGEPPAVARAVSEAELPRNSVDVLPESRPGALLSIADRLDFVLGLAATVGLPTGRSDPFGLRRAALGLLAVLRSRPDVSSVSLYDALRAAARIQPVEVPFDVLEQVSAFLAKRFEQLLVDEGYPVDQVRAVMSAAERPWVAHRLLTQLPDLLRDDRFRRLAEALQRARRIVPEGTRASLEPNPLLTAQAEVDLQTRLADVAPKLEQAGAPDLQTFTTVAESLTSPIQRFFDEVFVMDEDLVIRAARLELLAAVVRLGDAVLDWEQLRL